MPRWNDGLVDAFPVPEDLHSSLKRLQIGDQQALPSHDSEYGPSRFPIFNLPAELRNRVYAFVLFSKPEYRGADGKRKGSRLALLLASKRFHQEAAYVLYTTHTFMIFPKQEFTPLPTIQELPLQYRMWVRSLEMRIGSSWTAPPKSWKVTKGLQRCLKRLKEVEMLSVFVEFDPNDPVLKVKKAVRESYTVFCGELVADVLNAMPKLKYVQLDGYAYVKLHGVLVTRVREEAEARGKIIVFGNEAKWTHQPSTQ